MNCNSMRIFLLSSFGRYLQAIRPYAFLLKRYWPGHPPVVVMCHERPDWSITGFEFHVIGTPSQYPLSHWSDAVMTFLQQRKEEVFILSLEDMWITQPVNVEAVRMAFDYVCQFGYVARFDLTGDRLHSGHATFYGEAGGFRILYSNPDSPYHLSTMPAVWRKRHLLNAMRPGETPWELELSGTPRLATLRDQCIVLGLDCWPVHNTLAFRGGDTNRLLLDEVQAEDLHGLRQAGLLAELE